MKEKILFYTFTLPFPLLSHLGYYWAEERLRGVLLPIIPSQGPQLLEYQLAQGFLGLFFYLGWIIPILVLVLGIALEIELLMLAKKPVLWGRRLAGFQKVFFPVFLVILLLMSLQIGFGLASLGYLFTMGNPLGYLPGITIVLCALVLGVHCWLKWLSIPTKELLTLEGYIIDRKNEMAWMSLEALFFSRDLAVVDRLLITEESVFFIHQQSFQNKGNPYTGKTLVLGKDVIAHLTKEELRAWFGFLSRFFREGTPSDSCEFLEPVFRALSRQKKLEKSLWGLLRPPIELFGGFWLSVPKEMAGRISSALLDSVLQETLAVHDAKIWLSAVGKLLSLQQLLGGSCPGTFDLGKVDRRSPFHPLMKMATFAQLRQKLAVDLGELDEKAQFGNHLSDALLSHLVD